MCCAMCTPSWRANGSRERGSGDLPDERDFSEEDGSAGQARQSPATNAGLYWSTIMIVLLLIGGDHGFTIGAGLF